MLLSAIIKPPGVGKGSWLDGDGLLKCANMLDALGHIAEDNDDRRKRFAQSDHEKNVVLRVIR